MILIKYTLFAVIATIINLLSQMLTLAFYVGWGDLYLAIFMGTGTGLVTKYVLDKKYIFNFVHKNTAHNAKTFGLYTFTGIFTTIVFWGSEILFDAYFQHENAKYIGAIVGLSFGYVLKYFLDKKYVFSSRDAELVSE